MPFDWTFGKKLGIGYGAAVITLLVVALFGYESTHHLIENDRLVSHTYQVRSNLASFLAHMVDAESGVRGYLVTGDESLLDPSRSGEAEKSLETLRQLTADNPNQQRRIDMLRPSMETRLRQFRSEVEERKTEGTDIAIKWITRGDARRTMDEIRRIVAEMDAEELSLLERRRDEAEASAAGAKNVILFGSIAGVLFVALVGFAISRTLTAQVGSAVRHVQSSSAELQSAASQQATGAREQATAMTEISTTITELLATSRQIAESAERVATAAEQTAGAARSGDTTVQRAHESIVGIRRQVDLIAQHMVELGKKSQQIGGVLDIVSELAEQTNILAINATIEAAGAGETGKRFAVVADEIRKLADRVTGSTKEIRGLIEDVRSAVNTTVMTTETGSKAVDAGSRQFGDVASAFREIAGQVNTATEAAKEIGLSTKQQASAVEQVNVAISNVAQSAKESEISTGQTLQTASALAGLSRDLLRIVQNTRPLAESPSSLS